MLLFTETSGGGGIAVDRFKIDLRLNGDSPAFEAPESIETLRLIALFMA